MPRKQLKIPPEAQLIPGLLPEAPAAIAASKRADKPFAVVAMETTTDIPQTLEEAASRAASCKRCPLWEPATQTVFGEGPSDAPVIFVGEQPGDREDLAGRPFVGPAGQLFDRAMLEAGLDRSRAYVTNAVKHFKFEPRGKRRLHQKPNPGEIAACRWWFDLERALIKPRLIVAMGATAVRAVLGIQASITSLRGRLHAGPEGVKVLVTVHPSYLLRIPEEGAKMRETERFVADLKTAGEMEPDITNRESDVPFRRSSPLR